MIGDKLPSLIYDWDWDDTLLAMEDYDFMNLCYHMLSLHKIKSPQKLIITTPQQPLSHLLTNQVTESFIKYPTWENFKKSDIYD